MSTPISLNQLLSAPVVTNVISRIKTPLSRFQNFMGMQPGGPHVNKPGGHHTGWDIFDHSRKMAKGRPPGTGPATASAQPVGHVSSVIYRSHEKVPLLAERIFRTRPLGKNWGEVDENGQTYVTKQEKTLAQKFKNAREYMTLSMLKGGFGLKQSGDDWLPVATADGDMTINFQVPAGNTLKLNMLGAGDIISTSISTLTADFNLYCLKINAAFEQLHGRPLRHLWVNSTVANYILNNTKLAGLSGTANVVFDRYAPSGIVGDDGIEDTGLEVVLKAIPWLRIHIYDGGLEVNGTFTKFLGDTEGIFLPEPDGEWAEMQEGSEIVMENLQDQGREVYGMSAWTTQIIDPAGWELKALDNALPALYQPNCVAYASQLVY